MGYYPRKRTKKLVASVRCWANVKEVKPLGFAGYKVGMIHLMIVNNDQNSMTKGETISCPCTVIECPPLKSASIRFYKKTNYGLKVVGDVLAENFDKELERKIIIPKNRKKKTEDIKDFDDLTLVAYTQPKNTGIGKKKPELFEIAIGGNKEEKLNYAKGILGKEIKVEDVFKEGNQVDIHAITKGKGLQGPMKRFGITLRSHKSEKSRRNPGSLGAWCGQGKTMWRVAHAGQMGYFQRTELNKWLLKIGNKTEEINPKSGFTSYGIVKSPYILVKGSVAGPQKRLIRFNASIRPNRKIPNEAPIIKEIIN